MDAFRPATVQHSASVTTVGILIKALKQRPPLESVCVTAGGLVFCAVEDMHIAGSFNFSAGNSDIPVGLRPGYQERRLPVARLLAYLASYPLSLIVHAGSDGNLWFQAANPCLWRVLCPLPPT